MDLSLFFMIVFGSTLLPLLAIILVKIGLSYLRAVLLHSKLRALPTPPCSLWKRFTLGHDFLKILVRMKREDAAEQILTWSRKYGRVFKIRSILGIPCVILTSAEAIRHVTSSRHSKNYKKIRLMHQNFASLLGESSILLTDGSTHSRLRRIVSPTMRHSSLLKLQHVFIRHGQGLADTLLLKDSWDDDVVEVVHDKSFALIVDASFGDKVVSPYIVEQLRKDYFAVIREPSNNTLRRVILQSIFDFLPTHWFGYREKTKEKIRMTLTKLVRMTQSARSSAITGDKLAETSGDSFKESTSLLSLIKNAEQQEVLAADEAVSLVMTFIIAGQATTTFAITWLLYNLATHPLWQSRVRKEVESWDPDAEDALQTIDGLSVLDCVVRESLRHDPPISVLAREAIVADNIDGFNIPAGLTVRFPIFAIQRDPEVWGADADVFNPERWLRDDIQKLSPYFLLFWHGNRNCIGQRFAMLEIKTFIAAILRRGHLSTQDGDGTPVARGMFSNPIGMKIKVKPLPVCS